MSSASTAAALDIPSALASVEQFAREGHLDAAEGRARHLLEDADGESPAPAGIEAVLQVLVDLAIRQDHDDQAEQWLTRLDQEHPAEAPLSQASRLELHARLARARGRYAQTRPLVEQVLALRRSGGAAPAELARSLDALADIDWLDGRFEQGQEHAREAVQLAEGLAEIAPAELSLFETRLAQMQFDLGDEGGALERLRDSLARTEAALGDHPRAATESMFIANVLLAAGAYAEADTYYERADAVFTAFPDRGHEKERATLAFNRAELAARLGDVALARGRLDEAVRRWTAAKGSGHPHLAWAMTAMGDVLAEEGFEQDAHDSFERAVALRRALMPDTVALATSLARLALSNARLGNCAEALALALEAWTMSARATAGRETLERLAERATVEGLCGDTPAAASDFQRVLALARVRLGPSHPFVIGLMSDLAEVRLAGGRPREAFALAREAAETQTRLARRTLAYLPEADGLRFAARARHATDLALSSLRLFKPKALDAAAALELAADSRALVEDALARRAARQRAEHDPARAAARARIEQLSARYARVAWASFTDTSPEQTARLRDAADALTTEERASVRLFADDAVTAPDGAYETLVRGLPADTALVAFVRLRGDLRVVRARGVTEPSYLALVVRHGRTTRVVDLGSSTAIDDAVDAWRRRLDPRVRLARFDEREARQAGAQVTQRVWQPLVRYLAGARRVFLVPDGQLALMNFSALPQGSGYLIENQPTLHVLSAERELLRPPSPRRGDALVVLAAADYGVKPRRVADGTRPGAGEATTRFRGRTPFAQGELCTRVPPTFDSLSHTGGEARAISALWRTAHPRAPSVALTDRAATKAQLRRHGPDARLLHLATHGFFLDRRCGDGGDPRVQAPALNPLLLSGLALSGANTASTAGDDNGILTALDVAGLDLDGVEWAVLSACGSAVGRVQDGEGVLGLRRALAIAGARTVIMSMTRVEDGAARDFMVELYKARLALGLPTDEALRRASLARLQALRAQGRPAPPYDWGAFVAAGDWR